VNEAEAQRRAEEARAGAGVSVSWTALSAERRWISLAGADPAQPAPVRDLLAWVVHFGDDLSWAELALDDRTGALVRVERSR
jgi:hypothetical protein